MLVERAGDLDLLSRAYGGLSSDGGRLVLVRGSAGCGKTSLINEFARDLDPEAHVLSGSCDDLLTPMPFGPFWGVATDAPSLATRCVSAMYTL